MIEIGVGGGGGGRSGIHSLSCNLWWVAPVLTMGLDA